MTYVVLPSCGTPHDILTKQRAAPAEQAVMKPRVVQGVHVFWQLTRKESPRPK